MCLLTCWLGPQAAAAGPTAASGRFPGGRWQKWWRAAPAAAVSAWERSPETAGTRCSTRRPAGRRKWSCGGRTKRFSLFSNYFIQFDLNTCILYSVQSAQGDTPLFCLFRQLKQRLEFWYLIKKRAVWLVWVWVKSVHILLYICTSARYKADSHRGCYQCVTLPWVHVGRNTSCHSRHLMVPAVWSGSCPEPSAWREIRGRDGSLLLNKADMSLKCCWFEY